MSAATLAADTRKHPVQDLCQVAIRRTATAVASGLSATVVASLLMLCAIAPVARAAGDWPLYGKDLANSRNGATDGPSVGEVTALTQAWRFDTPKSDFTGTPVIAGGTVVAGTNAGWVYALDAVTGAVRWSRDVSQLCPTSSNGCINGTAAIDANGSGGGIVFVPIAQPGKPQLLALSLKDGALRWDATLSDQAGSDVYASPVFWNGTVYLGHSADQGDVSSARGGLVAFDEQTGAIRWHTYMVPAGNDGGSIWSTPAIDTTSGRLYIGTGNAYHPPAAETTDSIVALDAATGQLLAHYQATSGDVFDLTTNPTGTDQDFGASPNLFAGPGGQQLVGEAQKSGAYWALDRGTLTPAWHTHVGIQVSAAGGIIGSTAYDGARLYGPNTTPSEVWALDRGGSVGWISAEPGPINFSPVAVSNGVVYTTDFSSFLTARDAATGSVLAKLPLGAPTFGGVSVVGGAVYAAVGTQKNGSGSIIAFGDTSRSGARGDSSGGGSRSGASDRGRSSNRRCVSGRRPSFRLRARAGVRIVKVEAAIDGKRTLRRQGRDLRRVTLRRPSMRRFVLRLVITYSDGRTVTTTRTYTACRRKRSGTGVRRHASGPRFAG